MLSEICHEIRNFFEVSEFSGTFTISGGNISHPTLLNGQYFRIIGSVFNDGVHKYPADGLTDETFAGEVWALAIPPELIALASEIAEYEKSGGRVSAVAALLPPCCRNTTLTGIPTQKQLTRTGRRFRGREPTQRGLTNGGKYELFLRRI